MANVFFKRGSYADLPSKGIDGAFYLTIDTNRLYTCYSDNGPLVELNKSITVVDYIDTTDANYVSGKTVLPTTDVDEGQFYYVSTKNVLCVYTGGKWVQINPDTTLTADANAFAGKATTSTAGTNGTGASLMLNVTDSKTNAATGTVKVTGSGTVQVNYNATDGIVISGTDTNKDTTYTLKTENASFTETETNNGVTGTKVTLDASDTGTDSNITIKSANDKIKITQSNDVITLTEKDTTNTLAFNAAGALVSAVDEVSASVTPHITYGKTDTSTVEFKSGTATLDVYSTSQVDTLIDDAKKAIDSMTYLGTVSKSDATTKLASTANVGDTYKASESLSADKNVVNANAGDLIIATGTDGNVTWDVVQSGNDQTITFSIKEDAGTATVSDGANATTTKVAGSATDHISVAYTKTGNTLTSTVSQAKDYTKQEIEGATDAYSMADLGTTNSKNITVLTGIKTDEYGNVVDSSVKTQTITLTHNQIKEVAQIIDAANTTANEKVTVKTAVTDTDGVTKTDSVIFTAEGTSLKVNNGTTSGGDATVAISFEWGTF